MSLLELKYSIFERIHNMDNERALHFVLSVLDKLPESSDDELTTAQIESIKKSQAQWERGNFISGAEMIQNGKELLKSLQGK